MRFELLGELLPSTRLACLILSMDNAANRKVFIVHIASGFPENKQPTSIFIQVLPFW